MPATTASHLDDVGRVVGGLTQLGLQPVLVGGTAMVTIGRHFRDEARARKMVRTRPSSKGHVLRRPPDRVVA